MTTIRNQAEDVHGRLADLVDQAVATDDQLSNGGVVEFRDDPPPLDKLVGDFVWSRIRRTSAAVLPGESSAILSATRSRSR